MEVYGLQNRKYLCLLNYGRRSKFQPQIWSFFLHEEHIKVRPMIMTHNRQRKYSCFVVNLSTTGCPSLLNHLPTNHFELYLIGNPDLPLIFNAVCYIIEALSFRDNYFQFSPLFLVAGFCNEFLGTYCSTAIETNIL